MQNPNPKNTRNKRLHIVYFTDASSTKSTSISFRGLFLMLASLVCLVSTSAASIYFYSSAQVELRKYKSYVKDLKSGLVAQILVAQQKTSEKPQTAENISAQTNAVAAEIRNNPVIAKSPSASAAGVPVESLQGALKTTLSDQLVDKKPQIDFAPPPLVQLKFKPNAEVHPAAALKMAAKPLVAPAQGPAKNLVKFANFYVESEDNQTTFKFELTNTDQANIKSIFGRVCAVVQLKKEILPETSAYKEIGWVTLPANLKLDAGHQVAGPCPSGEVVRFARLRPTSVVLPVPQEAIEGAVLYFAELPSGRMTAHTIKNINDL